MKDKKISGRYHFKVGWSDEHKANMVELADGTMVAWFEEKEHGLSILMPKEKFKPMFEEQLAMDKSHIGFTLSSDEMLAISKGAKMLNARSEGDPNWMYAGDDLDEDVDEGDE